MTSPKVGGYKGRKRGALDLKQRSVINAEIAKDILDVYNLLGGPGFLYRWAQENPGQFINGPLARLMPAAPKDGADVEINNYSGLTLEANPIEIARRVAFALSLGMMAEQQERDVSPQEVCRIEPRWQEPTYDGPSITDDELKELAKVKEAEELASREHRGSAREHGLVKDTPVVEPKRVPVRLRRHPLI